VAIELQQVLNGAAARWGKELHSNTIDSTSLTCSVEAPPRLVPELSTWLFNELKYSFGGLVVEQQRDWVLRYIFYGERPGGWIQLVSHCASSETTVPSISTAVHAADWHEREAEDCLAWALRDIRAWETSFYTTIYGLKESVQCARVSMPTSNSRAGERRQGGSRGE
jgi:Ni,Fe-hydrogenase III component G